MVGTRMFKVHSYYTKHGEDFLLRDSTQSAVLPVCRLSVRLSVCNVGGL